MRANTDEAKAEARKRFLDRSVIIYFDAGLGHISEIADAEPPHTPRGLSIPGMVNRRIDPSGINSPSLKSPSSQPA